jgi:hypothetical protein
MPRLTSNDVPYSLSSEAARRAREAFQSALDAAVPAYQLGQLHLFQDDEESFIQKEVERKLYEQKLPSGGAKERRTVERLEKLAMEQEFDGCRRASYAVKMWKKVLADDPRNPGRYYIRHPITPRSNKTDFEYYNHLKRRGAQQPAMGKEMVCRGDARRPAGADLEFPDGVHVPPP